MGSVGITADSGAIGNQIWAEIPLPEHVDPEALEGQRGQAGSIPAEDAALIESQYWIDEPSEDDVVSQPRLLTDLWAEPAARRVLGFIAIRKVGPKLTAVRINPLPVNEPGRDLRWLCFGRQQEIDAWRSTNAYSGPALAAIAQWLEGRFMSLGGAMAASFPLPEVYRVILECLEPRQQQVLRRRVAGDTLDALGTDFDVSRERIRQIEHKAIRDLALHIRSLRAIHHPIAQALFSHVHRLANDVVTAASREHGVLHDDTRREWICKTLTATESECLLVFLSLADDTNQEAIEQFDPFLTAGKPFQGGLTAFSWNDDHVQSLGRAFGSLVGDRARRWVDLHSVCAAAGLERDAVLVLGRFANLTIHGEWVFEGRLKAADARRALVAEILTGAGRAMHIAEIMTQALSLGMGSSSDLRDFQRALAEDEETFVSDRAMWQMRADLGDVIEDRRPDNPALPTPPSNSELLAALTAIAARTIWASPLLEGLTHGDFQFAETAGRRIAAALGALPQGERRSIAQVLRPDDEATLIAWLGHARISDDFGGDSQSGELKGDFPKRVLEGLMVLAAMVSVTRATGSLDSGHWPAIFEACGEKARSWIFNTQEAPRGQALALLVEVAFRMRLRHAFSFQSDPWASMIGLQAGMLRNDLQPLPRWLGSNQIPVAIRHLVTPGPNYSASMACTWNTLQAYRRGHLGRDSVGIISRHSEWWPGWSVDVTCRSCDESIYRPERPREHLVDGSADSSSCDPPATYSSGEHSDWRMEAKPPQYDPKLPLGALEVFLDAEGAAFLISLPDRLRVQPGPVALVGDGFRVGGTVAEHGEVLWHSDTGRIRIGVRGPAERPFRIERGNQILASQNVQLWAVEDYLVAFPLGAVRNRPFDPFVAPLPRAGGLALLLHGDLSISADPDEEHSLDGKYVLKIFCRGLPVATKVSCEGEVLWEAEEPSESRRIIPDLQVHLSLDSASARWAGHTDLILSDPPRGFVPRKAYVGGQGIPGEPNGSGWRFPGFHLLPGMDALRRRGRLDGLMNGERVSISAVISLAQAPNGSALRDADGWHPVEQNGCLDISRHRQSRLWVCLPGAAQEQEWTVFEGPRPVGAYTGSGIRLGNRLFAFGEPLRLEIRSFNLNGTGMQLANAVRNSGIAIDCEITDGCVRLRLTTSIGWTERHKAFGWSAQGMTELVALTGVDPTSELLFALPSRELDGVCIFHGTAWLGSAGFGGDATFEASAFLAKAPEWPEALMLAVRGRLPILEFNVASSIADRLRSDGGKGVVALCRTPQDTAHAHVLSCLLQTWDPKPRLAEMIVDHFIKGGVDGSPQITLLERLTADVPCSVVRLIARGLHAKPGKERTYSVQRLIRKLVSSETFAAYSAPSNPELAAWAEQVLLDQALKTTGYDHNFLASKADASIASVAWANASAAAPSRYDPNLATCLTIAPVRRWLAVHLLARLALILR